MIDISLIKKLIQIVKEENISGLVVEEGGTKYEIRKEFGGIAPPYPINLLPHSAPAAQPVPKAEPAETEKETEEDENLVAITSPMVGTFYRAPSPDSPPFIEVGDRVEIGKVVCLVEAMKLFNEIESEVAGKVVKILVDNSKPVEYGQKLMLVKKD
jgi:acetyl-CoA carboxylase biotin carboxyl carrier protein